MRIAAVLLAASLVACAAGSDGPEPFSIESALDAENELDALDIGTDEPVVEESDELDDLVDPSLDGAEENPVADDPADTEEDAIEAADVGLSTMSLSFQADGFGKNEKRVAVASKTYKCRQKTKRPCVCKGSPYNCQFPSEQPGRNRYLPPEEVSQIEKRGGDKEKTIDEIGRWEIAAGTPLYDGNGLLRGPSVTSPCHDWAAATGSKRKDLPGVCVMVNFGQKKSMTIGGAKNTYVYAFSVRAGGVAASSWIPLSAVKRKATLSKMPRVVAPKLSGFAGTSYVLKSAKDWNQQEATFDADKLPAWAKGKIAKGGGGNKQAGDYLLRPGNVLNLIYSTPAVGGAATDTFLVSDSTVGFKRVKSTKDRPTLVRIPVASNDKKAMYFAYGEIAGRSGWVAAASIKKGTVKAAARAADVGPSCYGLADGFHCSTVTTGGFICANGAVRQSFACATAGQRCAGPNGDGTAMVCE